MKLNIGGQQGKATYKFPEGWTCVDILPGADAYCDIQNEPLPFKDASIDAIFFSHVLEHTWAWNHVFIVREFCRVLKVGGTLRIIVPDMDIAIDKYIADRNSGKQLNAMLRWAFDPIRGNDGNVQFNHVNGFNYSAIQQLLDRFTDFTNITKKAYAATNYPVFKGCDNPNHEKTSLYVEAKKL